MEKEENTTPNEEENTMSKEDIKKLDKQVYWFVGVLVACIALFLILYYVILPSYNTFTISGLTFYKSEFGEIPVFTHTYFYNEPSGQLVQYNLVLRNDPRENEVPIDGEIYLNTNVQTYVSIASESLATCQQNSIAVANLASFLNDNMVPTKGALADPAKAEELNVTQANCETNPTDIVILLQEGNETKIEIDENCYTISVADCEILKATEKFQVQSIIDAKARR